MESKSTPTPTVRTFTISNTQPRPLTESQSKGFTVGEARCSTSLSENKHKGEKNE